MSDDQNIDQEESYSVREDLKLLSFEELLRLKEEVGSKYYNKSAFKDPQCSPKKVRNSFHRENKNRPREESSKKQPKTVNQKVFPSRQQELRDPRFEPFCGELNKDAFVSNYSFLNEIRKKDISTMERLVKKKKDPEEKSKYSKLLTKLVQQGKSFEEKKKKLLEKRKTNENVLQALKSGKKVKFATKAEKKAMEIIDKYERLKDQGKLEKYLKTKNKKMSKKLKTSL